MSHIDFYFSWTKIQHLFILKSNNGIVCGHLEKERFKWTQPERGEVIKARKVEHIKPFPPSVNNVSLLCVSGYCIFVCIYLILKFIVIIFKSCSVKYISVWIAPTTLFCIIQRQIIYMCVSHKTILKANILYCLYFWLYLICV